MADPSVTLAIVGCNRLHYLRALIGSAKECIEYDNLEWIVVDNASIENGLSEYIEQLDFVQHKISRSERSPSIEHVEAMNKIVDMARGEYLLILPDDMQFVVRGGWLRDAVELIRENPGVGSVVLDAQRRTTINKFFSSIKSPLNRLLPKQKIYRTRSGRRFLGYGNQKIGVNPAGIGSLTRTEVWRKLGHWKTTGEQSQKDSTGGGEDEMLVRYLNSGMNTDRVLIKNPVLASIYAGPRNDQAYVRGNRRYATYMPPPHGTYYYRIWSEEEAASFDSIQPAASFEDIVEPIDYRLNMRDTQNIETWEKSPNDEFKWIHPSVEGVDIG